MNYKKILLTGSAGFLGSHVADALEKAGYEVVLFDSIKSKFKSNTQKEVIGNILKPNDIDKAIKGCDAVFHCRCRNCLRPRANAVSCTLHRLCDGGVVPGQWQAFLDRL